MNALALTKTIPRPPQVENWSDLSNIDVFTSLITSLSGTWEIEGPLFEADAFGWTAEQPNDESTLWVAISIRPNENDLPPDELVWLVTCGEDFPVSQGHKRMANLVQTLIILAALTVGVMVWRFAGDGWAASDASVDKFWRIVYALAAATIAMVPLVMFAPPLLLRLISPDAKAAANRVISKDLASVQAELSRWVAT